MEKKYKRKVDYKKLNRDKKFANEDIISEVAESLNVSEALVRSIQDTQSKFHALRTKAGGLESIMYVYLGKFKVNHRQVQKMMANSMKG